MTLHLIRSYKTITKTHDTNPSYTRIRHPTDSSSLPTSDDKPQNRTLKSHHKLRQQPLLYNNQRIIDFSFHPPRF